MFENGKFQMKFFLGIPPPFKIGMRFFEKYPPLQKAKNGLKGGYF